MSIVYLIECKRDYETVYKIGYSEKSANKRINSLQTGNDGELKVINSFFTNYGMKVERAIQNLFSHKKINKGGKEWFRLDLDDVQNFSSLCQKVENNLILIEKNSIGYNFS